MAQAETGANEVGLFSSIDLTGSGAPSSIEVVVSDFRVGDILRTTSGDVGSNYDAATGVLTLTSPSRSYASSATPVSNPRLTLLSIAIAATTR